MRIWRDIISRQGWQGVVNRYIQGYDANQANTWTSSKPDPVGKVAKLKGVFDGKYSDRDRFITHLTTMIDNYHHINKIEYKNIDKRIAALKDISKAANDFMKTFGIDASFAALRHDMGADVDGPYLDKDPDRKAYTSSNPKNFSFDRHILSLARRSLRKAGYLSILKDYYAKGGMGYGYRNPNLLLNLINNTPKIQTTTLVGLEPSVRLEQLDPVHRSNYEVKNDGACGRAFELWAATVNQSTPFFMYLEGSLVCLEDDKAQGADAQSVPYQNMSSRQGASNNKEMIVLSTKPLEAIDFNNLGNAPQTCSTVAYNCDPPKDPTGGGGNGVAAYVWTEAGELFIAEHRGHVFHHSSFVSGNCVRCAGMIKILNGLVVGLSNNSGHYKPRKAHMVNFVRYLQQLKVFAPNAQVEVFMGGNNAFNGTPAAFLLAHG